jgi:hypothetical protein
MNQSEIIASATSCEQLFQSILHSETYQPRGIFNSEALLLATVIKELDVKHIIESGRARGHSTNLLAKFFDDGELQITSIDFDKTSVDAQYSEQYLSQYKNLTLLYGDSNQLITKNIRGDCVVFIDGPKGDEAIQLAANLLDDKRVKAVAVHDLHKNTWHRNICEAVFSHYFFSDDVDYVERFKHLDDNCWEVLEGTGEKPYQRYGKPIASYASTLGIFFNSEKPLVQPAYQNYIQEYKYNRPTFKRAFIATIPHNSLLYKGVAAVYKLIARR